MPVLSVVLPQRSSSSTGKKGRSQEGSYCVQIKILATQLSSLLECFYTFDDTS